MNTQAIKNLRQIPLKGKRVFLRLDLNLPLHDDGSISDDTRLRAALPTLNYLSEQGATVAIASHLGRPKGRDPKQSLKPVATRLAEVIKRPVAFVDDCVGDAVTRKVAALGQGEFVVLENTRFHPQEEKNDPAFSAKLAAGYDVYINDAFGTLHRAHASTAGMAAHFSSRGMGLLVEQELKALSPLLQQPKTPFVMILGGAKVSDKLGIVRNLLPRVQRLLIGGGMAFTFLKANGIEIGASLCDDSKLGTVREVIAEAARLKVQLVLPVDFRIPTADGKAKVVETLKPGDKGLDIGPRSAKLFCEALQGAATLFWNGPLGLFEQEPFMAGTLEVARAVADCKGHTVIGGGDTLAAFTQLGLADRLTHASTGGGATLELLEGRDLPGLAALL